MAKVSDLASLAEDIMRDAATWYAENDVPQAFRSLHPMVLAQVRLLSGGDWSRVVADMDGSATVYNHSMWSYET